MLGLLLDILPFVSPACAVVGVPTVRVTAATQRTPGGTTLSRSLVLGRLKGQ